MTFSDAIEAHSLELPEQEVCGLVVFNEYGILTAIPCANTHQNPTEHFRIDPLEYLRIKSQHLVVATYHSHPQTPAEPSEHDQNTAESLGLPGFIYSVTTKELQGYVPLSVEVPYEGRRFIPLVSDCFTLAWEYYRRELGIVLPTLKRKIAGNRVVCNEDLEDYLKENRFDIVLKPRKNDVLVMSEDSAGIPSHAAIYMGDNEILHQPIPKPSEITAYGSYYQKSTMLVLRKKP